MKRVESLDYLRGIMALSVMLYHYIGWSYGTMEADTLLGKLGIYAVSIFYILSGLSLTIVYNNKIHNISDVQNFFVKRIFRIFPLFWFVVTLFIAYKFISSMFGDSTFNIPIHTIFLNYSLLFGFVEPTAYLSTGAWSIGNEMVFYAILPFIFLLSSKSKIILPVTIIISFIIGLYFSVYLLNTNKLLSAQWGMYVNPFNQIFLFMAGVAIGKWGSKLNDYPAFYGYIVVGFVILLFIYWPVGGDKIQIVTGTNRWIFSILSILLVLILYILNPKLKGLIHEVLSFLGQGCYSIYLLHPLVAVPLVFVFAKIGFGKPLAYIVSLILTLALSWVTFKYIESPMMNYGKKFSKKVSKIDVLESPHP